MTPPVAVLVLLQLVGEFGAVACRRERTSSMPSTANMMRRMPSVFAAAFSGSALTAAGVRDFISSGRP